MSKTLIFTATYNERDNIKTLVEKIIELKEDLDLLIIDDKSPDGTGKVLKDLQLHNKNLSIIIRERKLGLDTAHKLAFKYAKENNYDKFISLDADLSHDPNEIPKIIRLLNNHPFVIGSRYVIGGKCEMSLPRLMLSIIGNKLIKYTLGIESNEFTTSYRGFNFNKLINFDLNMVNSKGYSFFMETIFRINKLGFKIYEVPIHFKNRTQGKSKIPKLEIFRTLKNLFLLYFRK
jgi:dolichol-phosphate mannosyltransferase